LNNGKHGQGTHCTKMGADSLAENTPNASEFICPICTSHSAYVAALTESNGVKINGLLPPNFL
jgi:hypothetical protein